MVVKSVEVKKMVYMYLVHYADASHSCREMALLSINSFQKDLAAQNQLIRALALRVMTSIRVADIIQIPAFLCRQTDMLLAAGNTGAVVNIKKGQFLAPWDMANVVAKIESTGNHRLLLTERGASFGYNTLVSDMRSLPIMARLGYPVVMDATHSVQQPGGLGGASGGQREFAPVMARAAVSLGISAVFIETHPDPDKAPSAGPNMVPLDQMPALVRSLREFDKLAKKDPIRV